MTARKASRTARPPVPEADEPWNDYLPDYEYEPNSPLGPEPKRKPPRSARSSRLACPTEADELRMLGQWLDALGLVWCHVRNEGRPTSRNMIGLKPGVPDVLLFTVPPSCGIGPQPRGVAIELKRQSGGRTSEPQRQWAERLRECGWVVLLGCRGSREAIYYLRALGYRRAMG